MKNLLNFNIPFCDAGATFINCFASAYMFLENISVGNTDYDCPQLKGISCNSCGNCRMGGNTPIKMQEKYVFLFDTMCGRSSLRCRFDNEWTEPQKMICESDFFDGGTDNNTDFLFGFAGYKYSKLTDTTGFKDAIIKSIDAGKPIITKVKTGDAKFRLAIGYDGETLIFCPGFNAPKEPEPVYDEIEALYIIGDKTEPLYSVTDGLKRILYVMEYNQKENLWSGYTEKMGLYTSDSLMNCNIEEKKVRMNRVAETMWRTFNCHNFAEVFRNYCDGGDASVYDSVGDMKRLRDPALKELWGKISGPCCGYTHDLAWALIGLDECADWSRHAAGYFGEMVELTLGQISSNDDAMLETVKKAIEILEK